MPIRHGHRRSSAPTSAARPASARSGPTTSDSIFYFPWTQIRFLEIPPERSARRSHRADAVRDRDRAAQPPDEDVDEEIDEEFLRRVRDV